ncbi:MAG TPA: MBL fold metallo-hydrolase [Chloroflexia bacterium]|jgi:hypothetical protein
MQPQATLVVKVRMYRQGFGDCFLLSFLRGGQTFNMLIDCGVLENTEKKAAIMRLVAQDIKVVTANRIDLLVATHRHWDHVSGFLQARRVFGSMEVGRIWMPWTENPIDQQAARMWKRSRANLLLTRKLITKSESKEAQVPSVHQGGKTEKMEDLRAGIDSILSFSMDTHPDAGSTREVVRNDPRQALAYVSTLGQAPLWYLEPDVSTEAAPLTLPGLEGVRIYVLGPPRDMMLLSHDYPNQWDAEDTIYGLSDLMKDSEDNKLRRAFRRALSLDSVVNNTSLALAIELTESGKVLLFPADAQIGNWESWSNLSWRVRAADGSSWVVRIEDLLSRTVLYKVSHHGSHNGTLRRRGLELMNHTDLVAMVPVDLETAAERLWWRIPEAQLMNSLKVHTRGRVIRSDTGLPDRDDLKRLSSQETAAFIAATRQQDMWVELTIHE